MRSGSWLYFFNRPLLWIWALLTIAVIIACVIYIAPPSLIMGNDMRVTIDIREDLFGEGANDSSHVEDILILYLFPFKLEMGEAPFIARFQASIGVAAAVLLLACIGIILITKKSQNSIYFLGPLWTLSAAIILYVAVSPGYKEELFNWAPTIARLFFWTLGIGVGTRMLAIIALDAKWISGVDKIIEDDAPETDGLAWFEKKAPAIEDKSIECCPYCGNTAKLKKHPGKCIKCGNAIDYATLVQAGRDGSVCKWCNKKIPANAMFCWHCGGFQE